MSARAQIFDRLEAQARPTTLPGPWISRRAYADLAGQFTAALTTVGGEVVRAQSLAAGLQALNQILSDLQVERVVVNGDFPSLAAQQEAPPEKSGPVALSWRLFRVGQDAGDLRAICAQADVGISGAEAALAETGSVIVASGSRKSRLATLLPPVHIAMVPTSRLTADLFTWTAARQGKMPANVTLISGPSKTADIEQTLAIGVHGPKRFISILYEDNSAG